MTDRQPTTRQTHRTVGGNLGVTRRGFMRATAATAGAGAVGVGSTRTRLSPVDDAAALNPALVAAGATAAGIGLDYLMGTGYVDEATTRIANYAHDRFGDMRNYSGYTGGSALWTELEVGITEMQLADEKVFTSILNHIQASDNVAIAKGQVAIAEALNEGKTESEAQNEMEEEIDDYFSKIQQNIYNHFSTQLDQAWHHYDQVDEHEELARATNSSDDDGSNVVFAWYRMPTGDWEAEQWDFASSLNIDSTDGYHPIAATLMERESTGGVTYNEEEIELLNGELTDPIPSLTDSSDGYAGFHTPDTIGADYPTDGTYISPGIEGEEGEELGWYFPPNLYVIAWDEVLQKRDDVFAELTGYVSDIYAAYEPGEVDVSDVVDPTTFETELSTDNTRGFRNAAAAHLGIPTTAEKSVTIEVTGEDEEGEPVSETVWVDMYTDHSPEGGFVVGQSYQPGTWSEPLFIVYEDDNGVAQMSQLEDDFEIVSATDQNGNDIDSFDVESTTTHTSDVEQFQEELDALRAEQTRLLEQWQEETAGGGGASPGPPGFVSWLTDDSLVRRVGVGGVPNVVPTGGGGLGVWEVLAEEGPLTKLANR